MIAQNTAQGKSPSYRSYLSITAFLIAEVILICTTSSLKPLPSLLKCAIEEQKEQQRSPALLCKSFEALKVLTQSIWGKASPSRAELVRLHRRGHSRAQN